MIAAGDRIALRATFDEVAELYDRARPAYPHAVLDEVVALARLREGARVVEIGCGTGQASVPLARCGFELVCVELGARLAAVARRNLGPYPRASAVVADFETWEPDRPAFDAVAAFTSFHWLDPAVRVEKSARLLRSGGALAVVATRHVLPEGGDPFWTEVQDDYDAVVPGRDNRPPPPDEVGDARAELRGSGLFGEAEVRRVLWEVRFTAEEYVAVLETYSGHRALPEAAWRELFERVRRRVWAQPGGGVTKTYLVTVTVVRRR